jgi:hypothetical protein
MRYISSLIALHLASAPLIADPPKPNTLTPQELADGWILLFDGETTFGWKSHDELRVNDEGLILSGKGNAVAFTTTSFGSDFELRYDRFVDNKEQYGESISFRGLEPISGFGMGLPKKREWQSIAVRSRFDPTHKRFLFESGESKGERSVNQAPSVAIQFDITDGSLILRNIKLKPLNLQPLFNGKDLAGWNRFTADEKRAKSRFTVTPEGWLNVKDGPGDLQTEKHFADFIFQGDCVSHGKHLNSGIFFRSLPGQYQQGYEMQIRNEWRDNDRTKPVDFGTGAIYRRQAARKVVSTDGEWFTMTLIAHGRHMATWINGFQVVDWTDPRPENDNARNGAKIGPGTLSIQGHDPTTDLSFRNLRAAELK